MAVAALLAALQLRATMQQPAVVSAHDIDVAGMDRAALPGDDFFAFANGAWYKGAQIPADQSTTGIWADMFVDTTQRTRELLDGIAATHATGADDRKLADYYDTYIDEAAIEQKGIAPVAGFLKTIAAIGDRRALARWICSSVRADVDPLNNTNFHTDHLFGIWVAQDLNQPGRYTPYLLQGGLGMPDRDYYIDASTEMERTRARYRAHDAKVLELAGIASPEAKAERVFALERQIAMAHWPRTDSADVLKANNPWKRDDFSGHAPGLDWPACFDAAGLQNAETLIVWQPSAITGIAALVNSESIDTWRDYLTFHLLDHFAAVLPRTFVDEDFDFYGRTLRGTSQLRDRWKRAVDATNEALGDGVGRVYVQRYFPASAKARLEKIVASIITAFEQRIDRLTWMNPKTKANAKAKLGTLIVGIGYPDKWRDYGNLEVVRGEALMNAWRAELFNYTSERSKLGQRVDRTEWWLTPQTVNALNLPIQNALNFPAAILTPPFYDADADPAIIYGAIGAIIGHEISHSFDDQGSQFDADGKIAKWWTDEDYAHFKAASATLVAQYNAYEPLPGLHVNGQLTLSENIADLAGLAAAYDAYRASRGAGHSRSSDGFSDDQRFFIRFGQTWRSKMREPLLRELVLTDGHAPDRYRADTVRNLDAWYAAFDVKPGQRLFLAPEDRVRVW